MAAALSDSQLRAIEAQLSQNPAILRALQEDARQYSNSSRAPHPSVRGRSRDDPQVRQGPATILRQYGIEFPDATDYQIQVDPNGQVTLKRNNWFQRNAEWVVPVATIGTAGLAGVLSGPAATATSAAGGEAARRAANVPSDVLPSRQTAPNSSPGLPGSGGWNGEFDVPDVPGGGRNAVDEQVDRNKAADLIKKILAAAAGIGGAAALPGGLGGNAPQTPQTSPELQQMLQMAMRRMASQEPLFDAVNRQAFAGLPDYVKQGGQ